MGTAGTRRKYDEFLLELPGPLVDSVSVKIFGWLLSAWLLLSLTCIQAGEEYSISQRMQQYGAAVDARMKPFFTRQRAAYPPKELTFIIIKSDRTLQIYAPDRSGAERFITEFPVLAASGQLGPKLREGDSQVPEGIYEADALNPNSLFHLALHVSYPNADDRLHGQQDGRTSLGGDIMIHGDRVSVGCVAMGDEVSEDLFVLAAYLNPHQVHLIFAPYDFRKQALPAGFKGGHLAWLPELYRKISQEMQPYPLPAPTIMVSPAEPISKP